jgi:hypothetical protein
MFTSTRGIPSLRGRPTHPATRGRILRVLLAGGIGLLFAPAELRAQEVDPSDARAIVDRVDRLLRGESSQARVRMEIETENWSRGLEMEMWSLGTDHALIRVLSPQKEAGTATLKADQEVWNYLPRVDRTIKVPASLMMGSWMGSHFTNDDLVKESSMADDYTIELVADESREGAQIWEFRLVPRPDAPVVWGGVHMEVRQSDFMPTWVRYYDEDEVLVRTMAFSDYRMMGGRLVPAVMTVLPEDKPGERTVVIYEELEFDVDVDPSFFSLRNLRGR